MKRIALRASAALMLALALCACSGLHTQHPEVMEGGDFLYPTRTEIA